VHGRPALSFFERETLDLFIFAQADLNELLVPFLGDVDGPLLPGPGLAHVIPEGVKRVAAVVGGRVREPPPVFEERLGGFVPPHLPDSKTRARAVRRGEAVLAGARVASTLNK